MAITPKPVRKAAKKIINTYSAADKSMEKGAATKGSAKFKKAVGMINKAKPAVVSAAKKMSAKKK